MSETKKRWHLEYGIGMVVERQCMHDGSGCTFDSAGHRWTTWPPQCAESEKEAWHKLLAHLQVRHQEEAHNFQIAHERLKLAKRNHQKWGRSTRSAKAKGAAQ